MDRWATFDCYGTLIDWNAGIRAELARVFDIDETVVDAREADSESDEPSEPSAAEKELDALLHRYHQLEREIETDGTQSYRAVTTETMRRLGAPESEAGGLADSLPSWEPFPETVDALEEIRARGWKTAILSNSDRDLIDASIARLGVPFDETVVAGEINSFKPAIRHWQEFRIRTLLPPHRQIHVAASLFHDIAPTHKLRIPNIWINRLDEPAGPSPTIELADLTTVADALDSLIPA